MRTSMKALISLIIMATNVQLSAVSIYDHKIVDIDGN